MPGIAGFARLDGGLAEASFVEAWRHAPGESGGRRLYQSGAFLVTSPQCDDRRGAPPELKSGPVVIADARLDERQPLVDALGLPEGKRLSDSALVAAAFARWGIRAGEKIYGEFVVAQWNADRRQLTLARDALGVRTLYYVAHPDRIVFASSISALLALPSTPRTIDELAIADVLTRGANDVERTLFRAIRRVPPGASVTFTPQGREVVNWWTIESLPAIRFAADDDYVEAGRELLNRAVATRLPPSGEVATELSGGFDSTAVTATAARLLGDRRLTAYTRVAGAPHPYRGLDERANAASVVARYPNIDWKIIDTPPDASGNFAAEMAVASNGFPFGGSFNLPWFDPLYRQIAQSGARVLLVGSLGNMVLSWTGDGLPYELAHSGRFVALFRALREMSNTQQASMIATARQWLPPIVVPKSLRRARLRYRNGGKVPWLSYSFVSPRFLREIDYETHARKSGHDLPFCMDRPGRAIRGLYIMKQLGRDMSEYRGRTASFEVRDPFRDRRLVEFTIGTPESQFLQNGVRRSLARRVLADRLPAALLAENRIGLQSPEWFALASARRTGMAAAVERIAASPLASRVLDVERMRRLLEEWPADAEAAVGNEVPCEALYMGVIVGAFLEAFDGRG